jgi:hypothetical protein
MSGQTVADWPENWRLRPWTGALAPGGRIVRRKWGARRVSRLAAVGSDSERWDRGRRGHRHPAKRTGLRGYRGIYFAPEVTLDTTRSAVKCQETGTANTAPLRFGDTFAALRKRLERKFRRPLDMRD